MLTPCSVMTWQKYGNAISNLLLFERYGLSVQLLIYMTLYVQYNIGLMHKANAYSPPHLRKFSSRLLKLFLDA